MVLLLLLFDVPILPAYRCADSFIVPPQVAEVRRKHTSCKERRPPAKWACDCVSSAPLQKCLASDIWDRYYGIESEQAAIGCIWIMWQSHIHT